MRSRSAGLLDRVSFDADAGDGRGVASMPFSVDVLSPPSVLLSGRRPSFQRIVPATIR
jgi:hypothetical protein